MPALCTCCKPCTEKQKSPVIRTSKGSFSLHCLLLSLYFLCFLFFPSPCSLIRFPMGRARHLLYTVEDKDKTGCRPCCCVHISSACNSAPRLPLLSPPWNHYGVVFCSVDWLLAWIRVACSSLGANWPTFYTFIFWWYCQHCKPLFCFTSLLLQRWPKPESEHPKLSI